MKITADFCQSKFREAEGLEAIFWRVDHGSTGKQEMKSGGSQDAPVTLNYNEPTMNLQPYSCNKIKK